MSEAFVRDTPLKTGFHPPEQCVRGRTDCRSLAQIISAGDADNRTFMCCGELRDRNEAWPADAWSLCHRSLKGRPGYGHVDFRIFIDRRDMAHFAAVLGMGLATAMPDPIDADDPRFEGTPHE